MTFYPVARILQKAAHSIRNQMRFQMNYVTRVSLTKNYPVITIRPRRIIEHTLSRQPIQHRISGKLFGIQNLMMMGIGSGKLLTIHWRHVLPPIHHSHSIRGYIDDSLRAGGGH